jgi:AcrR family transcriptional regulator
MRELGRRLSLSAATISAIENGQTGVSVQRLGQFADAFGITAAALLSPTPRAGRPASASLADWRRFAPLDLDPVLAAALGSFVATGYHGSNMRGIADGAGMSLSGVYTRYPSKQQLLVTILELTMAELEWRVPAAASEAHGPVQRLHRQVEALALFHVMRADLAFIGASEMRSLEQPDRDDIAGRRSRLQHRLDHDILDAVRNGSANCPRPLETARAIATMCTSLPQWFDSDGPTSAESVALEYADLAVRMVGAQHASHQGDPHDDSD